MSWGWKIALLYGSFVLFILFMVMLCLQQDFELVTDNYYQAENVYPEQVRKKANNKLLSQPVQMEYKGTEKQIVFQFPKDMSGITGKLNFYRPSNASSDFSLPIKTGSNLQQTVNSNNMLSGLWRVQIDWEADGTKFFEEKVLVVN